MSIEINGFNLTIEDVAEVARGKSAVVLSEISAARVQRTRDYVDAKLHSGDVIYGLNTGFGALSNTMISLEDAKLLQRKLIISHACAMGDPYPEEIVRAAMLLRANALAKGNSGICLKTLNTLITMLNERVHPIIPQKGSLGASGDLAPLAHMVLVMLGEGEAIYRKKRMSGAQAMLKAGIPTIELEPKEGLALINGTQIMTAIACLTLHDARKLCTVADIAASLTIEASLGITKAFDAKIHLLRGHPGQIDTARNLMRLLDGSGLALRENPDKVQDAYSIRCVPQVHGASKDAVNYAREVVTREINAVTDNPIIFPDEDDIISGGNFHGQPVALVMDFLAIAVSELASISERRIERLVNPQLSGLPAFLIENGGLNSGLMITQYAAASMVSENKILSHPASVDSIPSSANQEDHVSMGTTAARKAIVVLDNTTKVIAIELLASSQALTFRDQSLLGKGTKAVYNHIRKYVSPITEDIITHIEMNKLEKLILDGSVLNVAKQAVTRLL